MGILAYNGITILNTLVTGTSYSTIVDIRHVMGFSLISTITGLSGHADITIECSNDGINFDTIEGTDEAITQDGSYGRYTYSAQYGYIRQKVIVSGGSATVVTKLMAKEE